MLTIVFLVIQVFFAIFLLFTIIALVSGAPFVPSSDDVTQTMVDLATIKPGMKIYDLGSGDGRVLLAAAAQGATAVGAEINPFVALGSLIRILSSSHRAQVRVLWKNLWNVDVSDADVVFVYLLPWHMEKLKAKLKKELRKGTLVVSNSFIFPHWKILRQDAENHVYVFRKS